MNARKVKAATVMFGLLLVANISSAWAERDPIADNSKSTRRLENLTRQAGAKKVVTIYEFRSSVAEAPARGATDMFTTALIKSGAFAVAERNRLNDGVMQERALNGAGVTTGNAAARKLAGADYIFEGTISESNQGAKQNARAVNIGGMAVQSANISDEIGIDVRIVDANSGVVLDAINIRNTIETSQSSVSNVGSLIGNLAALRGRSLPVPVDANVQNGRRESIDKALRACIEMAVLELVKRFATD